MKHTNPWLKLYADIFDNAKMIQIDTMPNSEAVQNVFIRLLCYACELGNNGVFSININGEQKAFTSKMFAKRFHKSQKLLEKSLKTFEELKIISRSENAIFILGWSEYQSKEQSEERATAKREYMSEYNKKAKKIQVGYVGHKSELCRSPSTVDVDLDVEVEVEKDKGLKNIVGLPPTIQPLKEPNIIDERFEIFWKAYPKKEGKGNVRKWFAKKKPSQSLLATMLIAIDKQRGSQKWIEGYVPMPMTWLNQGRWEDEIDDKSIESSPINSQEPQKPSDEPENDEQFQKHMAELMEKYKRKDGKK